MADQRLIKLEKNFQVFVGIDFGTDGTGLAYALPTGEVFVHQKWKGYKRSVEVKPKTRILLDQSGKFLAFGQPATNSYITMGGAKTGWMLFERFKMALYNIDPCTQNQNNSVDLCDVLTAVNGKKFSADLVFIEALKYIKCQVFKFFTKNKLQIENIDDIQWILTVPAIWSEKAKYKMEQWAQKAELINKQIPNHLKIVYEPDCASLSIQYEIQKRKKEKLQKEAILRESNQNKQPQHNQEQNHNQQENDDEEQNDVQQEHHNKQENDNEEQNDDEEEDHNQEEEHNDDEEEDHNKEEEQNDDEEEDHNKEEDPNKEEDHKKEEEQNDDEEADDNKEENGNEEQNYDEEEDENKEENDNEEEMIMNDNEEEAEEKDNCSSLSNEEDHWLCGEKYILIDAGGGTCDVACHEILGDFAVSEVVYPTGGPWGSTYIDDYFVELLYKIFNKEWMSEFKREDPSSYTELIDNFRVAKQEFWREEDDIDVDSADKWHNVQLPFDFCTFLEEKVKESSSEIEDCDLETLVEETLIDNKTGLITLEEEYLRLNYFVWMTQLFDLVIEPILKHCKYLLTETIMKNDTRYICLVGGLGSSKYLQSRIKSIFGASSPYGLEIIVPSRPILSVVDGAARFGLQPDYIQARTLAKTYGNAIDPKIDVIDIDALPPGYLEANQYRCDHTGILRVRNIFSVYARRNQTIHIRDKPIIRKYKRFNNRQKKVRISVYKDSATEPIIAKGLPLCKTTVVFPPNSQELSIIVELYFNDTKIRVFAYPEDDPQNKKEMELDYEYK